MNAKKWIVVGASVAGKSHTNAPILVPCQDSHCITFITESWGVAVVCDGAGSARHADLGATFVAQNTAQLLVNAVEKNEWHKQTTLPDYNTWQQWAYSTLAQVRHNLEDYAQTLQVPATDLACTLIAVVFSPIGLLTVHIGDGRAGFCNAQNEWHAIIKPYKGEEANQTIFMTSAIWENYEEYIKVHCTNEKPLAFTLMSDGCEAHAYQIGTFDYEQEKYTEINQPYPQFFNPLVATIKNLQNQKVDFYDIQQKWCKFVEDGNDNLINEPDDKTLILGILRV